MDALGQWWLPEAPDTRVFGVLRIHDDGLCELELLGALRSPMPLPNKHDGSQESSVELTDALLAESGVFPRILGQADGRAFTLEDCFQTQWLYRNGEERQVVRVNLVLDGVWLELGEPANFHTITFELDYLESWAATTGVRANLRAPTDGVPGSYVAEATKLPSQTTSGPGGAIVALHHVPTFVTGASVTISEQFCFTVEASAPLPLTSLIAWASDVQDLVSIGTGQVAAFRSVKATCECQTSGPDPKTVDQEVTVRTRWAVRNPKTVRRLYAHDRFFTLDDIGGMSGVASWMLMAEERQSLLNRVMTSRYHDQMLLTDRLFNRAAAVERLNKDLRGDENDKSVHFIDRLKREYDAAGPPMARLAPDREGWAEAVRNARNAVGHHNKGIDNIKSQHYWLAESVYWLFVLRLLQLAGAPQLVVDGVGNHRQLELVRDELVKLL